VSNPQLTPEQFQTVYPRIEAWIRQTLADHLSEAKTVVTAVGDGGQVWTMDKIRKEVLLMQIVSRSEFRNAL